MCPSYIHMQHLEEGLGSAARRVALGAQDVSAQEGAAHTGEGAKRRRRSVATRARGPALLLARPVRCGHHC